MHSIIVQVKNNILILALFFLITFPAYSALLHSGMLTSHDGEGHIVRMFEFNTALDDGNFPVRWSKRLNWGLGYPFFNFNYPLTYYLTYFFYKLGFDLLSSFKAILILSFPLGAFFVFLWLKKHFSNTASFIGGLFYTLIPYHFLNVYVRGNLAETLALTITPLGLYLVYRLYEKPGIKRAILLNFCLSSILLTHNITGLLFIPTIFIFGLVIYLSKKSSAIGKKYLMFLTLSFLLTLLSTCFFWLPAFYTKQFINIDQIFPLYYPKNFPNIADLIYSTWGYGGSKSGPGQMSVQIGLLHLLVLTLSGVIIIVRFNKILQKRLALLFICLSILTFFMMLAISKPIWDILKPIQYLQFPWRLLSVLALTSSFLAAFLLSFISKIIPKKLVNILALALIAGLLFLNRNHWRANEYYDLPDYWFLDEPLNSTTTADGEQTPKWQTENLNDPKNRFELISGTSDIKSLEWKTNYHRFSIESKSDSRIADRTVYFPGWTVFIDGSKADRIDQNNPETKGLIAFAVSKGKHLVEVKLLEPDLYKIADGISIVTVIILIIVLCRPLIRR